MLISELARKTIGDIYRPTEDGEYHYLKERTNNVVILLHPGVHPNKEDNLPEEVEFDYEEYKRQVNTTLSYLGQETDLAVIYRVRNKDEAEEFLETEHVEVDHWVETSTMYGFPREDESTKIADILGGRSESSEVYLIGEYDGLCLDTFQDYVNRISQEIDEESHFADITDTLNKYPEVPLERENWELKVRE